MFITPELFHNAPVGSPADEVGKFPKIIFPLVVSIALKSAAAVSVVLIYKARLMPLAPPVWLTSVINVKIFVIAVPLVGLIILYDFIESLVPLVAVQLRPVLAPKYRLAFPVDKIGRAHV